MRREKICNYRRCEKELSGRKDKKFCDRNCKDMEYTYRKRNLYKQIKYNLNDHR